eukprot:3629626-Pyramimonas_sp.AAC.1
MLTRHFGRLPTIQNNAYVKATTSVVVLVLAHGSSRMLVALVMSPRSAPRKDSPSPSSPMTATAHDPFPPLVKSEPSVYRRM